MRSTHNKPHPDGMQSQAIESEVESFVNNSNIGLVKTNHELQERLLDDLSEYLEKFFEDDLAINTRKGIKNDIIEFYNTLEGNPAKDHLKGSTGNGLNLWLFLLVRQLQPSLIVESGVWIGRSLYSLKMAMPEAEIHAFDISFNRLLFAEPSIKYYENDWSKVQLKTPNIGFVYFDDHINNGRRIREAYEKGFRHLVFDQCASVGMCHPFRYPGLPSAIMIANNSLRDGDILEWTWSDQKIRYCHKSEYTYNAEALIELVMLLPSLENWIGERTENAVYVRLKQM